MKTMIWRKNIQEASSEISGGTRLLLMLFHGNDQSSVRVLNETLTNDKVVGIIEREAVALKFNVNEFKEMAVERHIDLTPTFIIADESGRELERWVGYLPAQEFVEQMILSKGLAAFHLERLEEAVSEFEELVADYPDSQYVPEAEYYLGAAAYKQTGTTDVFGDACEILTRTHPDSIWTKKCSIWAHETKYKKPFVGYNQGGSAGSGAY